MRENIFVAAVIIGIMLFFTLLSFADQKRRLMKMKRRMVYYYGRDRETVYSDEVLSVIGEYADSKETLIDDITWNDLDLDSVFMELNHTWSFAGEDYLYYLMHIPEDSAGMWNEQEELITYYETHEKERVEMQMEFARIGKNHASSVYRYIVDSIHLNKKVPLRDYAALAFFIFSIALMIFDLSNGFACLIICMVANIALYFSNRKSLEYSMQALQYFLKLQKGAERILKKHSIPDGKYQERLEKDYKAMKKKIGLTAVIRPSNIDNQSLSELVFDYIRMMTHLDSILFYKCMARLEKSIDVVENIITTMGFLESMICVGSLRKSLPYYCVPEFTQDNALRLTDAYHPGLAVPVPNSITANRGVLLTGSNASGKSTFLKTVALNVVLAQSLHTCPAKTYQGAWFKVFSSMALRDNIYKGESYYIAEIRALKRIFDYEGEEPILCFVDEVLRGTNTIERIAASTQVLEKFAEQGILCFAATHDIELTYLLENLYDNYHFQEEVMEQEVLFDYLLYKGRSSSRNAIRLLEILGYDEDIIHGAEQMVSNFTESGKWMLQNHYKNANPLQD